MIQKLKIPVLLFFLVSFTGCNDYYYQADLLVTVKGLLSGNPREGLAVQIFETRDDAEMLRYALTPVVYTDEFGEVLIYGLEPRYEYYIRVDALLITKIKGTGRLRDGANTCVVRIL